PRPGAQAAPPPRVAAPVNVPPPSARGFGTAGASTAQANAGGFAALFPPGNNKPAAPLSAADINTIVSQAANSINSTTMVVAVVDRQGTILGLFRKSGGAVGDRDAAVALARTAAFFSHKQAVLTSRTVRFISGEHFPPNIQFTANGALFGIEQNNRGCDLNLTYNAGQSFPQLLAAAGGVCDSGSQAGCGLGSLTIPGSFPLYKGNDLVGAVGVFGVGPPLTPDPQGGLRRQAVGYEAAEFAAVQGAAGFEPPQFSGGDIFIDGIRLPGVTQTVLPPGFAPDPGGFAGGTFDIGPAAGAPAGSTAVPSGFLVGPTAGGSLTLADVNQIIQQSIATADRTRAAIRLPFAERARMIFAVGDVNGNILAVFRQSDSTIFSLDVAVTKARNVVYFSGAAVAAPDRVGLPNGTAVTNRTISFGSQRFFPAGIDFAGPGPFRDVFLNDALNPCSQGRQAVNANQSGIVFFPGSVPLYKNGVLVGGLGVSGDGVEQDDFVAAGGASGFEPPPGIRSDQFKINGVRMPYLKFPRNPTK
ncbi:MAG: heme-binding protein, partial [Nitrospinaceae bacterium]